MNSYAPNSTDLEQAQAESPLPIPALGIGIAHRYATGNEAAEPGNITLDTWFPAPILNPEKALLQAVGISNIHEPCTLEITPEQAAALSPTFGHFKDQDTAAFNETNPVTGTSPHLVAVFIADIKEQAVSTSDAYLRLHLLSHCLVQPHGTNLDGIFTYLPTVAWTSAGPCLPEQVAQAQVKTSLRGHQPLHVYNIDKFPRFTDYVSPPKVRIADASRVRLGAHLAPGTTVMHEGFVNFNAGTLGSSMVEGRISAGVVVGNNSDVGGGASIMGTLSGGGKEVISIGEHCLIGANAGLGISLGHDCIIEAGCYVTAGSKVTVIDGTKSENDHHPEIIVKAAELSGKSCMLFRRNSLNGRLEVVVQNNNRDWWGGLNPLLHA